MITPPFAPEILAEFPELTALGRTATRLHPRRATGQGAPRAGDSHVGGPLAWPADEPWPVCTRELRSAGREGRRHASPNPLVPVAQLWASDIPDLPQVLPALDGADLLQVLWCPVEHLRDVAGPAVLVRYRRAADLPADLLTEPPQGDVQHAGWIPTPCLLHPERITDHPGADALPAALRDRMPPGIAGGFVAPGWKVGGHPRRAGDIPCPRCGTPAELLLVITDHEYDAETYHWIPVEEQDLDWSAPDNGAHERPTGLRLDADLHLFTCPGCGTVHVT
ncbi:hypothetical protein [Dactylosporangium sp. NPDC005555]|uniref:hypothetical protein n=1 Tax=Dactylosporangium sp. NPDC005555 TaxID=3154889 RepID=UPI0033AA390A